MKKLKHNLIILTGDIKKLFLFHKIKTSTVSRLSAGLLQFTLWYMGSCYTGYKRKAGIYRWQSWPVVAAVAAGCHYRRIYFY